MLHACKPLENQNRNNALYQQKTRVSATNPCVRSFRRPHKPLMYILILVKFNFV